ncbi:hypothetical protein [Nocardia arthritidis]|uniref:SprT-like domain-containing protein n=1 Tax=Nocardia arthritidis TaxID=228602 RepID=A0A6G9YKS6_9NOCA|nr:hypothetical protein [Nocardia arthritidis]QIS13636.1 hypothetical protein F5544_28955 [Nocardia arthritidis]
MSTVARSLVSAIESVWTRLRERHPDVPDMVVAMASGHLGRGIRLGHFDPDRWVQGSEPMSELFIGFEGFAGGARDVLGILLHQAAHGAARTRGVADTSRAGAYHNGKFRNIAREFGLTVDRSANCGWSETHVPDTTAIQYEREITTLAAAIVAQRRGDHDPLDDADDEDDGGDAREKAPRNGRALVCTCSPARRVRAHKKTIDAGPILCGVCHQPFAPQTDRNSLTHKRLPRSGQPGQPEQEEHAS